MRGRRGAGRGRGRWIPEGESGGGEVKLGGGIGRRFISLR